jgi:heterodisulfide reductase subunit C
MLNLIKGLRDFSLNEGVNEDLIAAKKLVNDKLVEIGGEIANEKEQTEVPNKIASIRKQASLYAQMPALMNKLADSIDAKEKSGDSTNIY